MKKILPVHYPIVQHVPANAYLMSIIGDKPDELAWIMNNFVNLRYNSNIKYDDFFRNDMWYNCYHITESRFTKDFLDLFSDDPFELIKKMIDAGYYIYMFLNRKYIKNYNKPEYDVRHNPLIYGYDEEENKMYIADFFRGRRFGFETCSIDEFRQSYPYTDDKSGLYIYVWNRAIKKKEGYQYRFNVEDLIIKLKDYLNCTDLNASHYYSFDNNDVEEVEYEHIEGGYDYVYGLDVYDAICEDLMKDELKNRPMNLLYEHKRLMSERLAFLNNKGYLTSNKELSEESTRLKDESLLLRNLFLKYRLSGNLTEERRKALCDKLMKLKDRDRVFVYNLINALVEQKEGIK